MDWFVVAGIIVAAFLLLAYRRSNKNIQQAYKNLEWIADNARAADNALLLAALSREIANELIQRDVDAYNRRFQNLVKKWMEIEKKDTQAKLSHLSIITSKYKSFSDFDELGSKAHVLYADGFSWKGDDELWDLYENIRLYDALSCNIDEKWRNHGSSITGKEAEHLRMYCKKINDTKLLAHLHRARDIYFLLEARNAEKLHEEGWEYESNDYKICRVPHFCESRYGVYIKNMDRYGLWGVFNDKVTYTSFYSTNSSFSEQKCEFLDTLNAIVNVDNKLYENIEKLEW